MGLTELSPSAGGLLTRSIRLMHSDDFVANKILSGGKTCWNPSIVLHVLKDVASSPAAPIDGAGI